MRTARIVSLLLVVALGVAACVAQMQPVLDLREDDSIRVWEHAEGTQRAIHTNLEKLPQAQRFFGGIRLDVVVSGNGRVNEAHAMGGPKELLEEAERIERDRIFKPFTTKDGTIVTARITDTVAILPPEGWQETRRELPRTIDPATVSMTLERTGCMGSCPGYTVTVRGDGSVQYHGELYVLVPGDHRVWIKPERVAELLDDFRRADFLSAKPRYVLNATDGSSQTITLTYNNERWQVYSYFGRQAGLPDAVEALEDRIDEVAGTSRWVKGDGDTLATLKAEHWNFASRSHDNLALFNSVLKAKRDDLIETMLAAGLPTDIAPTPAAEYEQTEIPLCVATAQGNLSLVQRLIKLKLPAHGVAQRCLLAAAGSGNLDMVNLWIQAGARPSDPVPTRRDEERPQTILTAALASHAPEVVERVLQFPVDLKATITEDDGPMFFVAGPGSGDAPDKAMKILTMLHDKGLRYDERNSNGETLLFRADSALLPFLVQQGIPLNVTNKDGETALMHQYMGTSIQALLDAGADPTVVDHKGKTALDHAGQYCVECVKALEAAWKKRGLVPSTGRSKEKDSDSGGGTV